MDRKIALVTGGVGGIGRKGQGAPERAQTQVRGDMLDVVAPIKARGGTLLWTGEARAVALGPQVPVGLAIAPKELAAGTTSAPDAIFGRDFNESNFNRAVQAARQPGSAFKPVIYAACGLGAAGLAIVAVALPLISLASRRRWYPRLVMGVLNKVDFGRNRYYYSRYYGHQYRSYYSEAPAA